jgi:putative ABC transport system substrate-binding protein
MFCAALALSMPSAAETILVLKSHDSPQYNEAVNGFIQEWTAHGMGASIQTRLLADWANDVGRAPVETNARPLVIVAVGTDATRWAITNATVPVVFCMVANARQSVMADLTPGDEGRVHGVSLDIPAQTQLRQIMTVLPKVKRVGVLYDPEKSASAVREMKQAATELGLEVVDQKVIRQSSLPEETAAIASRIDLLWAPVDSTVFNSRSAQFVLTQMLQRKVPVMGFSENMVKAGALLGPRVSYTAIGRQTAELLRAILNPSKRSRERVQAPQEYQIVVNGRVLALLGNSIPQAAIGQVSIINNEE